MQMQKLIAMIKWLVVLGTLNSLKPKDNWSASQRHDALSYIRRELFSVMSAPATRVERLVLPKLLVSLDEAQESCIAAIGMDAPISGTIGMAMGKLLR